MGVDRVGRRANVLWRGIIERDSDRRGVEVGAGIGVGDSSMFHVQYDRADDAECLIVLQARIQLERRQPVLFSNVVVTGSRTLQHAKTIDAGSNRIGG